MAFHVLKLLSTISGLFYFKLALLSALFFLNLGKCNVDITNFSQSFRIVIHYLLSLGFSHADDPENSGFAKDGKQKCVDTFCNASRKSWSGIDFSTDCSPKSNMARFAHPLWICSCLADDTIAAFEAIRPIIGKKDKEPLIADCVYPLPPIIMCPEGMLWVEDLGHGLIALYVIFYCIFMGGLSLVAYRLLRYDDTYRITTPPRVFVRVAGASMPLTQRPFWNTPGHFNSPFFFRQGNFSGSMIAFGAVGVLSAGAGIFILGPILYYEWKHQYQNAYPVSILPEQMPPSKLERVSAEDQSDTPSTPVPQRDAAHPQDSLPSVSSSIDSMEARIQNQVSSPPVSRGRVNFPSESPGRSTRIPVPSSPPTDRDRAPMSRLLQRNDLPIYQASVGIHFLSSSFYF